MWPDTAAGAAGVVTRWTPVLRTGAALRVDRARPRSGPAAARAQSTPGHTCDTLDRGRGAARPLSGPCRARSSAYAGAACAPCRAGGAMNQGGGDHAPSGVGLAHDAQSVALHAQPVLDLPQTGTEAGFLP